MNRHALTPDGWVHEQENSKLAMIDGEQRNRSGKGDAGAGACVDDRLRPISDAAAHEEGNGMGERRRGDTGARSGEEDACREPGGRSAAEPARSASVGAGRLADAGH